MIGMILISLMPILRWVVALWTGQCWSDYSRAKTELCIEVWLFLVADRVEGARSLVRGAINTRGCRGGRAKGGRQRAN